MPSEDKVVKELSFQVSIAEHVGNYGCTEERNEDTNVTDTTADKLATGIKVDEISSTTKVASQSTNVHENVRKLFFGLLATQFLSADIAKIYFSLTKLKISRNRFQLKTKLLMELAKFQLQWN